MKITKDFQWNEKGFCDVPIGEVIIADDMAVYLKTQKFMDLNDGDDFNAIDLSSGEPYFFEQNEIVKIPKIDFRITI